MFFLSVFFEERFFVWIDSFVDGDGIMFFFPEEKKQRPGNRKDRCIYPQNKLH